MTGETFLCSACGVLHDVPAEDEPVDLFGARRGTLHIGSEVRKRLGLPTAFKD